jgi:hypothetical protein
VTFDWKIAAAAGAAWYFFLRPGAAYAVALPIENSPGPSAGTQPWNEPGISKDEADRRLIGAALANKTSGQPVNVPAWISGLSFSSQTRQRAATANVVKYDPNLNPQSAPKRSGGGLWGKIVGATATAAKFVGGAATTVTKLQATQAKLGAELKGWTGGSGITRGAA